MKTTYTLFLTSSPSGPLDGSFPVQGLDERNDFVNNLRTYWKENSRCLMIAANPDAFDQNDEMAGFSGEALRLKNLSWESFTVWDHRKGSETLEDLTAYDVVFLGGGHVPTQNQYFHEIGLREKFVSYKGIVIGISAGSMNSADVVYAQPELPGEAADPEYQKFLEGLGLTREMILPHYQMVKDFVLDGMRLFEDITYGDSYGQNFLVLPDGSYLLSVEGKESIWGEAYRIRDGRMERIETE